MRHYQYEDQERYQGYEPEVQEFIQWVYKKLHIDAELPDLEFAQEKESEDQHRTGYFNHDTNHMWIYVGNRNLIDILRTVAHELTHYKQKLDGQTSNNTDLVDLEGQADQAAGIMMKIYVRQHPEIIQ